MGRPKGDVQHNRCDSIETRSKILAAAEKLFAEHGVNNVTVTMIINATGQRNPSAINYHFGNKSGIIREIIDKHEVGIRKRINEMLETATSSGKLTTRNYVKSIVVPYIEKLNDPNGGVAYIRIMDQLIGYRRFTELQRHLDSNNNHDDALSRVVNRTKISGRRKAQMLEMFIWFAVLIHGVADYSWLSENEVDRSDLPSQEEFTNYLIDTLTVFI